MVARIRNINQGADIRLSGYETFGARDVIIVYANAETDDASVFYKFTLVGTKPRVPRPPSARRSAYSSARRRTTFTRSFPPGWDKRRT